MSLGYSSMQNLEEGVILASCWNCPFVGKVDAWYDPELGWGGWRCPDCDEPTTTREGVN